MSGPVPPALRGLWRRERITAPGFEDTTTEVFWLQTETWYVDLRVPADRPRMSARTAAACTPEQRRELARAQGFCGELSVADGVCVWRRDLDLHAPSSSPDEGAYELRGDVLIERGIHAEYEEIWRKAPGTDDTLRAFKLGNERGLLVTAGDHFMALTDDRRVRPVTALDDLVVAEPDYLNIAICYGRIAGGPAPWFVTRASLPWLEGAPLAGADEALRQWVPV